MSPIAPLRPGRQSRLRLAYLLAVLLPVLGTVLTQHMAFLHGIPNSTNLLAVVVVGILGGLWPSLVAIGVAVVTRCLYIAIVHDHVADAELPRLEVDADRFRTANRRCAHAAGDDGRVAHEPAARREDALGRDHPVQVVG